MVNCKDPLINFVIFFVSIEKKYQLKMHLSIPIIIMHLVYTAIACNTYINGGSELGLMLSLNNYFNCDSEDVIKFIILMLVLDLMLLTSMDMLLRLGIKKMKVLYLISGHNAYLWSFLVLSFSSIYLTNDFNFISRVINLIVFYILLMIMIFMVVFIFIFDIYLIEIKSKTLTQDGNKTEKSLDVEMQSKTLIHNGNTDEKALDVEIQELIVHPSKSTDSDDPSHIEEIFIEFDMAIKTGHEPSTALCSAMLKIFQSKNRSTIRFESETKSSEEQEVNNESKVNNVEALVKSLSVSTPVKSKRFVTHEELDQFSTLMPYHHDEQSIHELNYPTAQTEVKMRNDEFKNPIFEYESFKPVHYADVHAPSDDLSGNITESQTMHKSCRVVGVVLKNDCNNTNTQSLPNDFNDDISEMTCKWQDDYLII